MFMLRFEKRRFLRFLALWGGLGVGVVGANAWLSAQESETPAAETAVVDEVTATVETEAPAEEAAAQPFTTLTLEQKVDKLAESSVKMDDAGNITSTIYGDADTLWTCLAAFLVFFMQAGFALVEAGLTRAKNTCNILMKNLMDFVLGSIVFWMFGFGLMFGATAATNGWIGTDNFLFNAEVTKPDNVGFGWAFLIFQTVFCATAATIVSGAMAERTKFISYLVYTVAITGLVYPVFGGWAWGNLWQGTAWLGAGKGFLDFAGSTVVHSIGGWAALAGALFVGPRIGKFIDGKPVAIPGHSIPMLCLGVFILWLGWFGFNPGSTTAVGGGSFAFISVTTNIAACGGGLAAMITAWVLFKKPDVSFTLNGVLAGLVSITAGCNVIPVPYALLTGAMAGVLVVLSCVFFDRIRIDDPVGAISVHGVCGAFGTICTGLFAKDVGLFMGGGSQQLIVQLMGVGLAFVWSFGMSSLVFFLIKSTLGLRVSEEEELEGLDVHEHGMAAYPVGWVAVADGPSGHPLASGSSHTPGMPMRKSVAQPAL
jgi:Amt family ammonium transporter